MKRRDIFAHEKFTITAWISFWLVVAWWTLSFFIRISEWLELNSGFCGTVRVDIWTGLGFPSSSTQNFVFTKVCLHSTADQYSAVIDTEKFLNFFEFRSFFIFLLIYEVLNAYERVDVMVGEDEAYTD